MKRLLASFFGITFLLVIIQVSLICFTAYVGGMSFQEAMTKATIYDVQTIQIGNQEQVFYIFNIKRYVDSLRTNINASFQTFEIVTPLEPVKNFEDVLTTLKTLFNILLYVINWLILLVNITLFLPIKILMAPIIFLIAIIGIDTNNLNILDAINKVYQFNINYIPYVK